MSKRLRIVIAAAVPVIAIAVFALKDYILGLKRYFPECFFHKATGYWCPGCGNTRSVTHMLHGHFVLALRNNITIPFLGVLLILLYAENLAAVFGRDVKFLPRKGFVWAGVIAAFIMYFVIRNFIPAIAPI